MTQRRRRYRRYVLAVVGIAIVVLLAWWIPYSLNGNSATSTNTSFETSISSMSTSSLNPWESHFTLSVSDGCLTNLGNMLLIEYNLTLSYDVSNLTVTKGSVQGNVTLTAGPSLSLQLRTIVLASTAHSVTLQTYLPIDYSQGSVVQGQFKLIVNFKEMSEPITKAFPITISASYPSCSSPYPL